MSWGWQSANLLLAKPMLGLGRLTLLACLAVTGCTESQNAATSAAASPAIAVGRLLGGQDTDPGFARALVPIEFSFPGDHGAHPAFRSEWWYLTLMLTDDQGRDVGGQFTLFRQAQGLGPLAPTNPWLSQHLYMAHLAVTDVARQVHFSAERFARGHPSLAGVTVEPKFRAWLDGWQLRSPADSVGLDNRKDNFALELQAATEDFAWDLHLQASKPKVLQGDRGFSAKGPGQASYYYSYTRLRVAGEVRIAGEVRQVQGGAWLDREWSTSVLSAQQQGWDWFALQLDDGRDLMVFRLRRHDGVRDPYDHGVLVAANGISRTLQVEDFVLQPSGYWQDATGVCWPTRWLLQLGQEQFSIVAQVSDQVMETTVRYWEGITQIRRGEQRLGRGYMELTGYLPQPTLKCEAG